MSTKKKSDAHAAEKPAKKSAAKKAAKRAAPKPAVKKVPKTRAVEKSLEPVVAKKTVSATPKALPNRQAGLPAEAKKAKEGEKETRKATVSEKQKIRVIIRAFDHKIVDESAKTIIETAERSGSLVTGAIPLPTHKQKVTLNRSTFINKDAREQFEIRTHKRLIDITEYTSTTIEALSNLNLPAGVDVEIKML